MSSPIILAKRASYEEFLKSYDPAMAATCRSAGQTLLFSSVANRDIDARVAITTRLLDDGADPTVVAKGLNVLHVLFGRPGHDAEQEAPMLRRLIEGGADVNLVSKRYGPPLVGLIEHGPTPESARVPFYNVLFERPGLDLSAPYGQGTLRDFIFNSAYHLPLLRKRVEDYEKAA
ncbi:hypothetical protein BVC93_11440 [Mycobacterium sp. MS1601]|uniref:hypothetical protein n=1 Tax=Mycobacterium sp. MS1601 TaxID=1936029 RepID=UPI00097937D7|nr:hypothetical protein [Mycobacterium sp. MS1601]AQA02944.1 hypothetical protein BVC93_11440 [Mycobacterium sp. MS1601]